MDDKTYQDAKKNINMSKSKEGFMVIYLDYSKELILPHKDGLAFLASLANAEMFSGDYDKQRITDLVSDTIKVKLLSHMDYERHKLAALLNVTYREVREYEASK